MAPEQGSCVVVGDGGFAHWALAYHLRKAGWGSVTLVGDPETPLESPAAAACYVSPGQPPRLQNYTLFRNALWHPYFMLHAQIRGTSQAPLPPRRAAFSPLALLDPEFWNWAVRLWPSTDEDALRAGDVVRCGLMRRQREIMRGMAAAHPALAQGIHTHYGATDVFFDRGTFGDQRQLMVSLEQGGDPVVEQMQFVRGKAARALFPSLFATAAYIVGAARYPSALTVDLPAFEAQLRKVCTEELAVRQVPVRVSALRRSEDARRVTAVALEGGQEVQCDAVVLAAGADTPRLLRAAGGPPLLPVYAAAELVADVKSPQRREGGLVVTGAMPEESGVLQAGPRLARLGDTVRVAGLLDVQGLGRGKLALALSAVPQLRPSRRPYTSGAVHEAVAAEWAEQLDKWAALRVSPGDVTATWVGEAAMTPDGLPVVGSPARDGSSRAANVWLCAALGPGGGSLAVAAAQAAAELSAGREPAGLPREHLLSLSPRRFWLAG
eukprot:TRINITY_DN7438_c0_g3_i1.p1 TRINITY_DN7438_c0_g3~~TRINITY_DN7438_c0_g3_i1.p1  ORF type:complete len:495 (+),score=136.06 TRINITY_DN7438_c0_g3_i1:67-1551(+)